LPWSLVAKQLESPGDDTSLWHDRLLLAPPLDRRLQPADARAVWRRWILTKPNSLLVSGGEMGCICQKRPRVAQLLDWAEGPNSLTAP
jgi:hypothetical protein